MKSRAGILLVTFFATLPFYWEKTREAGVPGISEAENVENLLPPLVLRTSLYDSLPANIVDMLDLGAISGTKVKYRNGLYASYYQYSTDRRKLLSAMALMPVPIRDRTADTSYHKLDPGELQALNNSVPLSEFPYDEGFWSASKQDFDIIESVKPPFRHLFLISKSDRMVFHRVTPLI